MGTTNDGGPAFPFDEKSGDGAHWHSHSGMTRPTGEDAMSSKHVEVLERLRDRWATPGECAALDAAIAALTAPQPPAEAQRCTCPSGDGSLRWPCPAHPPEAQPVATLVNRKDADGGKTTTFIRPTGLGMDLPLGEYPLHLHPSAPVGVEWLCRVYADAYHAGHHATVEGNYVDVLPVDRDTYWREKVEEDYPEACARQPAPVAPVGVERKYPDDGNGDDDAYNRGWNDCLDALAQQPAPVDGAMAATRKLARDMKRCSLDGATRSALRYSDDLREYADRLLALAAKQGGES